eukprot:TRINITY_DN53956_c0_g1_i1.p1 TRINITY_DN53956_c0_g1~~TRINITY_DN53956_c0_g1_i1.p1  ORF type:complete len:519 (+),score=113.88 TRINITY_DN53956_c0_g1_i1:30-1586(+)
MAEVRELAQGATKAFNDGDALTALQMLTRALSLCRTDPALWVNRSQVYLGMRKWKEASDDATAALELDKNYTTGWFRLGAALLGAEDYVHGIAAFNRLLRLDPTHKEAYEAIQKARIQQLFMPECTELKTSVLYLNPTKRWGMFVKKKVLKNEIIFKEKPIVAHQLNSSRKQFLLCGYCLKTVMSDDDVVRSLIGEELLTTVKEFCPHINYSWPANPDKPKVPCLHCKEEVYCSESCRDKAWHDFHSILCVGEDPQPDHPVLRFRNWVEEHTNRNCQVYLEMTAKICAIVASDVKRGLRLVQAWDKFHFYCPKKTRFLSRANVELAFNFLKDIISAAGVDLRLTDDLVEGKLSQLALNMQVLQPIALTHNVHVPLPAGVIAEHLATLEKFPQVPYKASAGAAQAPVHGVVMTSVATTEKPFCVGLFKLQSCINHSCMPTVTLENEDTSEISVYATCDMDLGDELTSCYVDMDLDFPSRQDALQWYEFTCDCPRCKEEQELLDIAEKIRQAKLERGESV